MCIIFKLQKKIKPNDIHSTHVVFLRTLLKIKSITSSQQRLQKYNLQNQFPKSIFIPLHYFMNSFSFLFSSDDTFTCGTNFLVHLSWLHFLSIPNSNNTPVIIIFPMLLTSWYNYDHSVPGFSLHVNNM